MKKYIGFAALMLLFLQFNAVTCAFTVANAQAIDDNEKENVIFTESVQLQGPSSITIQTLCRGDVDFYGVNSGANVGNAVIVHLASDPNGSASDNSLSSANYQHDYLLDNFWDRYQDRILLIAIIIILSVLYATFNHLARKKQYTILEAKEEMLRNITNNINGGVLVLNPQKEYQISYVNDGYLKLLGYSIEEINNLSAKAYFKFIHPEDRSEFEKLIVPLNLSEEQYSDFSTQLRIKSKNGTYIPTLVKASLMRNKQGEKELFCVVMDILREHAMLEELEFEQARHRILMEKSDEILFEINYDKLTVMASPQFKEKFGWSLPRHYWGDEEPDLIKVFEEDRQEFLKELSDIYGGKIDGEFIARICKSGGTPCWCKILYHVMRIDGEQKRLIGKITDIDVEMKEKQSLLKKAQMDALSGLYNKESFRFKCVDYLTRHPAMNSAIVFFDVDNFKDINDRLGHAAGDGALRDISDKMKLVFSNRDILGRFGGDEFCALLKDVREEELKRTLDGLLKELRLEYGDGYQEVLMSVSIGAVLSSQFGNNFDKLLEYADKAQYYAKEKGKNSYALYNSDLRLRGYESRQEALE